MGIEWHKYGDRWRCHFGAAEVWPHSNGWRSSVGYTGPALHRDHATLGEAKARCESWLSSGFIPISLEHPNEDLRGVEVELIHVRANDGIRLEFDFDRDGWSVQQPVWDCDEQITGWREVYFAQAWRFYPDD